MVGNLGVKEIRDFMNSLDFNIEEYLEIGTFNEKYNSNQKFHQASVCIRKDGDSIHYLEPVKAGMEEELKEKVNSLNQQIEEFIYKLSENGNVVPSIDKKTFLYFRRVPDDYGIYLRLIERDRKEEIKQPIYFVCKYCGKKFNKPQVRRENVGFTENPHWEDEITSPCCRYDFEEIYED